MKLEDRILDLARQGFTPYQIEEELDIKHFTIHIKYHKVLMQGYSESEQFSKNRPKNRSERKPMTEEERTERKEARRAKDRAKRRRHYEKHREEILAYQKRRREERKKKDETK